MGRRPPTPGPHHAWVVRKNRKRDALAALGKLRKQRAADDEQWAEVGRALHAVDTSLLSEWTAWSGRSCAAVWAAFRPRTFRVDASAVVLADGEGRPVRVPQWTITGDDQAERGECTAEVRAGDRIQLRRSSKWLSVVAVRADGDLTVDAPHSHLPLSDASGAWVQRGAATTFRLPEPDARWGLALLQAWAAEDEWLAGMDATEFMKSEADAAARRHALEQWQRGKERAAAARLLLRRIDPEDERVDARVVGKALHAVHAGQLLDDWVAWCVGDRSQCSRVWHSFRPRSNADAPDVAAARRFLRRHPDDERVRLALPTELVFLDGDSGRPLRVPRLGARPDDDELEAPAVVPRGVELLTAQEPDWLRVVNVDLAQPAVEVSVRGVSRWLSVGLLAGAWVRHPDEARPYLRLPVLDADWGLRTLRGLCSAPEKRRRARVAGLVALELRALRVGETEAKLGWVASRSLCESFELALVDERGRETVVYRGAQTAAEVRGLDPLTDYRFRVTSRQPGLRVQPGFCAFATRAARPPPPRVRKHLAMGSRRSVVLALSAGDAGGARVRFELSSLSGGVAGAEAWDVVQRTGQASVTLDGLEAGQLCAYRVVALNADGLRSEPSNALVFRVPRTVGGRRKRRRPRRASPPQSPAADDDDGGSGGGCQCGAHVCEVCYGCKSTWVAVDESWDCEDEDDEEEDFVLVKTLSGRIFCSRALEFDTPDAIARRAVPAEVPQSLMDDPVAVHTVWRLTGG